MMGSAYALDDALLFLNPAQAAMIDAFTAQIIPSEAGSPGAREAAVTSYIDRSLAGFMRDLQSVYRTGLRELADLVAGRYSVGFVQLSEEQQRDVVASLDQVSRADPSDFLGQFYRIVREHTVQGFFGDPAYGGNRGVVGWKLVGFPGAQWGYSPEQMRPGVDAKSIPILTVKDLYTRIGGTR
ncbi:gluconate 2-dehydrogenase subunit 3 family protein [Naasia sp.]|uniref:gluconate 2-dehydrogenase subunit 3 family protein n=1 Tax=Naasia sp. TaxID=2546198 RepID=UPI00261A7481|nr:gluconate 2-dehydrogenase subunit 3 family protein [Naasia sp.]